MPSSAGSKRCALPPGGSSTEGKLVVLDRQLLTVFVYDRAGNELPPGGEWARAPASLPSTRRAATGEELGRLARDIAIWGPDEDYMRRTRERLRARGTRLANVIRLAETFPLTGRVFAGPPGRTIWVRRHLGVKDALSPSVEELSKGSVTLYDLFSSDDYDYMGTVRAPDGLTIMAGDGARVAGAFTDELGVATVRLMLLVSLPHPTTP